MATAKTSKTTKAPAKVAAPKSAAPKVAAKKAPAAKKSTGTRKTKSAVAGKSAAFKKAVAQGREKVSAAVNVTRDASLKLVDSQRAIWLAGLGALAKATSATGIKGEQAFDALVKAGEALEAQARGVIDSGADRLKTGIDGAASVVDQGIDKAGGAVDTIVEQALERLGFPKGDALKQLFDRLTEISKNLESTVRSKIGA